MIRRNAFHAIRSPDRKIGDVQVTPLNDVSVAMAERETHYNDLLKEEIAARRDRRSSRRILFRMSLTVTVVFYTLFLLFVCMDVDILWLYISKAPVLVVPFMGLCIVPSIILVFLITGAYRSGQPQKEVFSVISEIMKKSA